MNRQQALNQLRLMQAWHEDNGDGPNADYDAICYAIGVIEEQPEIIHCKDCAKHNKGVGDLEVLPNGKRSWIWKDQACPLVSWRGKAQGHEFDYQYCAHAERRTE